MTREVPAEDLRFSQAVRFKGYLSIFQLQQYVKIRDILNMKKETVHEFVQ